MTPYAATMLVNKALMTAHIKHPKTGVQKVIQPTMLYVYAAKGKFKRMRAEDGRWAIDRPSFDRWLAGYIDRLLERQTQREELEDEQKV